MFLLDGDAFPFAFSWLYEEKALFHYFVIQYANMICGGSDRRRILSFVVALALLFVLMNCCQLTFAATEDMPVRVVYSGAYSSERAAS